MGKLIKLLAEALIAASDHLDYCGYGDNWENECARESGLEEQIEAAIKAYKEKEKYAQWKN